MDTTKLNNIVTGMTGVTAANQAAIVSTLNAGLNAGEDKPTLTARLTAAPIAMNVADADDIIDAVLAAKKAEDDAAVAKKKMVWWGCVIAVGALLGLLVSIPLWTANSNATAIGDLTKVVDGVDAKATATDALSKQNAQLIAGKQDKLPTTCGPNNVLKFDGSSWKCAIDSDSNTLGALNCQMGEVPSFDGTSWVCASLPTPVENTDTLAALNCAQGEVAMMDNGTWVCKSLTGVEKKAQDALDLATTNEQTLKTITKTVTCRKSDPKCVVQPGASRGTKTVAIAYYGGRRLTKSSAAPKMDGTAAILLPGGRVKVGTAVCNGVYDAKADRCNGMWVTPTVAPKPATSVRVTVTAK